MNKVEACCRIGNRPTVEAGWCAGKVWMRLKLAWREIDLGSVRDIGVGLQDFWIVNVATKVRYQKTVVNRIFRVW